MIGYASKLAEKEGRASMAENRGELTGESERGRSVEAPWSRYLTRRRSFAARCARCGGEASVARRARCGVGARGRAVRAAFRRKVQHGRARARRRAEAKRARKKMRKPGGLHL